MTTVRQNENVKMHAKTYRACVTQDYNKIINQNNTYIIHNIWITLALVLNV